MVDLKLFYFSILFILLIFKAKSDISPEVRFIVDGTLNGTAAFVSLEFVKENVEYLYFTYDFEFHSNSVQKNPNIAFFIISSEFEFTNENPSKEKINYGFTDKVWTDINNSTDINNINWEEIKLLYKEKPYSDFNYYYEIHRTNKNMKTLIIRIPINGHKEGSITVENILKLPDFNDKNSDI